MSDEKKCCHEDKKDECCKKSAKRSCCESQAERLVVGCLISVLFGYLGWKLGGLSVPVFVTHAYFTFLLCIGAWFMCFLCIWRAIWPPRR